MNKGDETYHWVITYGDDQEVNQSDKVDGLSSERGKLVAFR